MKRKRIIFLDIDGVLNSNRFACGVHFRINARDKYGEPFDPVSAKFLNDLIEATGADVVISSTWRSGGLEEMQAMWKDRGMSGKVVGVTPYASNVTFSTTGNESHNVPRGMEIKEYYEDTYGYYHWSYFDLEHAEKRERECTLESFVIIDDDTDMLYDQRNNFVHCDALYGFERAEYDLAYKILTTPRKYTREKFNK